METEQIQEVREQKTWKRGTVRYLIELVDEGFKIMKAYVKESNLEIYLNRRLASQHHQKIPTYDLVVHTYEMIKSQFQYLKILGIPDEEQERLMEEYIELGRKCEQKRRLELRGLI